MATEFDIEFFRRETDKFMVRMNGKLDMIEKQQAESEARTDEALNRIDKKMDKLLEITSASAVRLDQHQEELRQHDKRIVASERERATLRSEVDVFKDHVKNDQPVESWLNAKIAAAILAAAGVIGAALLNHYVAQAVTPRESRVVYESNGGGRQK
jgi:hypothetical protein